MYEIQNRTSSKAGLLYERGLVPSHPKSKVNVRVIPSHFPDVQHSSTAAAGPAATATAAAAA